jgi:hypothetical protein
MFIKNYYDYLRHIKEGLIKTHEGEDSIRHLIDVMRRLKFDVSGSFKNDIITLEFVDFKSIPPAKLRDMFDMISSLMVNKFGWFPSSMDFQLVNGVTRLKRYDESEIIKKASIIDKLKIEFDSKFDGIEIYSGNLYHLSIQEYKVKILKNGLFPKSKSKLLSHIDRVYLCKSLADCKNLIPQMKLHYSEEKDVNHYELVNKKWKKDTKWIIYEIKNDGYVNLHKDPRCGDGYYTMDNISPDRISIAAVE